MQTDWVKLYSHCCLTIKDRRNKGSRLLLSECATNTRKDRLPCSTGAEDFETKEVAGQSEEGGNKRLCWNLSKANNHSGAGDEYYIRVANQYRIT